MVSHPNVGCVFLPSWTRLRFSRRQVKSVVLEKKLTFHFKRVFHYDFYVTQTTTVFLFQSFYCFRLFSHKDFHIFPKHGLQPLVFYHSMLKCFQIWSQKEGHSQQLRSPLHTHHLNSLLVRYSDPHSIGQCCLYRSLPFLACLTQAVPESRNESAEMTFYHVAEFFQ